RTVCVVTAGTDPLGSASLTTRPSNGPLLGVDRPSTCAMVRPTSALLVGTSSTNVVLKPGAIAAMKFMVSARLKLPSMPCPFCNVVSAASTAHISGCSQPAVNERKLITIAGDGVTAVPFKPMADNGSVPGNAPKLSSTNNPLT